MTNNEKVTVEMDVSKILSSILTYHKSISVPTDILIGQTDTDKQLEIKYDEETNSFVFTLGDQNGTTESNN